MIDLLFVCQDCKDIETSWLVNCFCTVFGMLKDLKRRTFTQKTRTHIIILKKLKNLFLIHLPHQVWEHSSLLSLNFVLKVDFVNFQEDWAHIPENYGYELIEFDLEDAALKTSWGSRTFTLCTIRCHTTSLWERARRISTLLVIEEFRVERHEILSQNQLQVFTNRLSNTNLIIILQSRNLVAFMLLNNHKL